MRETRQTTPRPQLPGSCARCPYPSTSDLSFTVPQWKPRAGVRRGHEGARPVLVVPGLTVSRPVGVPRDGIHRSEATQLHFVMMSPSYTLYIGTQEPPHPEKYGFLEARSDCVSEVRARRSPAAADGSDNTKIGDVPFRRAASHRPIQWATRSTRLPPRQTPLPRSAC